MAKCKYEWFLFDYEKGYPDRISKPFKTKAAAEKAQRLRSNALMGSLGADWYWESACRK